MADWLEQEVRVGLTRLYTLMLDRMPPADAFEFTVREWIDAVTFEQSWSRERDEVRVRGAFDKLRATFKRWPAPRDFLEALPVIRQKRLPRRPDGPREPTPVAVSAMAECRRLLSEVAPAPLAAPLRAAIAPGGPTHYDRAVVENPAYAAFDESVAEMAAQPEGEDDGHRQTGRDGVG